MNSRSSNIELKEDEHKFLSPICLLIPIFILRGLYTNILRETIFFSLFIQITKKKSYKYCVTYLLISLFIGIISYNTFNRVLENVYLGHAALANKVYNNIQTVYTKYKLCTIQFVYKYIFHTYSRVYMTIFSCCLFAKYIYKPQIHLYRI